MADRRSLVKPLRLEKGDRVRLVAPAGPFDPRLLEAGQRVLAGLGLVPVVDGQEFAREGFLAGADRARARRLTAALGEETTQAVWCIRGGYGTARLLRWLDLPALRRHPKLLVGFSDVTALLVQLASPGGFVTIHGPVITQLPRLLIVHLRWLASLLFGMQTPGEVPLGATRTLVPGKVEGRLMAGNLSTLVSLAGTSFAPDLRGAVLCLEDVNEQAYRLDRLFWQLASAGLLAGVRGIVLGDLVGCTPGGGRHSARRVLEEAVSALRLPSVSGRGFGHGRRNLALPIGARVRLDAGAGTLRLLEPAVC